MFTPPPIIQKIWNGLTGLFQTQTPGQQRPVSNYMVYSDQSDIGRNYDLEIREPIVRAPDIATPLAEMVEYCPEVTAAIGQISAAIWSSDDGDDMGFSIGDEVVPGVKCEPEIKKILDRVCDEVIGGTILELAGERMLQWGDCFAGIGINTKKMQIDRVMYLPTWEMFRMEDNQARPIGFEQRKYLSDHQYGVFPPLLICHWRYRRKLLYGRGLFNESIGDWYRLKDAIEDLAMAARSIGFNPNIHLLPDGCDDEYALAYKTQYEQAKKVGPVTDFFLMGTGDIKKVANLNPDLSALANNVILWRERILMSSHVPNYLLGVQKNSAKEIAGQPALGFSRFTNSIRRHITTGIRQICDLELALHDIPQERWKYSIVYPKIGINPYGKSAPNTEDTTTLITDEDS